MRLPVFIRIWFAADLVLALLPPLHWMAGGMTPVLGVPRVLFYLFGTSVFITASVLAAYACEPTVPKPTTSKAP